MIILIIGTPDSGKSALAEKISVDLSKDRPKYYIATMIPYGTEGNKRVEKHRKMRSGKGFTTLEWPDDIERRIIDCALDFHSSTVLLECMSNLIGNEMHSKNNTNKSLEEISELIVSETGILGSAAENLVIVTNDFPVNDEGYDEDTKRYISLVIAVNKRLFDMADKVFAYSDGEWHVNEAY